MDYIDTIRSIVTTISNKWINKATLNKLENDILTTYMTTMTNMITNNIMNINDCIIDIYNKIISNNKIIKLNFSNDTYICVSKETLDKIEYFKNMLNDCNDANNIVNVDVVNFIDNYQIINNIILYLEFDIYNNSDNIHQIINTLKILSYFGEITYKGNNKMSKILLVNNTQNDCNMMSKISTELCEYNKNYDIEIKTIEEIYTILKQNNICNYCKTICQIWLKFCDNNKTITQYFELQFYVDVIVKSTYGKNQIIENIYYQHYEKIWNLCGYNDRNIIISSLLELNTIDGINTIANLKNKYDKEIDAYIKINVDKVTDVIFTLDISTLDKELFLLILIQLKKIDMMNDYFKTRNIWSLSWDLRIKIFKFVDTFNNTKIEPTIEFHAKYTSRENIRFRSFLPLILEIYTPLGTIVEIENNNVTIDVIIKDETYIDLDTTIVYCKQNKNKKCIISKILKSYAKDGENKLKEYSEIIGDFHNTKQRFIFVVNDDDVLADFNKDFHNKITLFTSNKISYK